MPLGCPENVATPHLMPGTWMHDAFSYIEKPSSCSSGYEGEEVRCKK